MIVGNEGQMIINDLGKMRTMDNKIQKHQEFDAICFARGDAQMESNWHKYCQCFNDKLIENLTKFVLSTKE